MTDRKELSLTLAQKLLSNKLDALLISRNVPKETREAMINSFEMMYEYIPYAIKQGKNPSDGKVLADFLASKASKAAKFMGKDYINCGIAIFDLFRSGSTAIETSSSVGVAVLPATVLAWGLATLDLIEVGNSCTWAQEALYYGALKEDASHVLQRSSAGAGVYNTSIRP